MKSHVLAIRLWVPLLLVSTAVAIAWWQQSRVFYATPETESVFLKNYTPEHIIECFRERESFSQARNFGSAAGYTFVGHQAGFQFFVVLRPEKWMPLMNALRDDVLQQLANNGAEVLSQNGNPHDGFHFDYRLNKSIGSLTILPLGTTPPSQIHRNTPLPQGMGDVTVKIEQTEKWFPKGAGTSRSALQASSSMLVCENRHFTHRAEC
jgi:hypothetical protein